MAQLLINTIAKNTEQTAALAIKIASLLKPGGIVLLSGDLGSGKTFLCQKIIKHFCPEEANITSPTFNILHTYESANFTIYHYDLYRIKNLAEIYELGIEEALSGQNLCLIEWPEIIKDVVPQGSITIEINILDNGGRTFLVTQN